MFSFVIGGFNDQTVVDARFERIGAVGKNKIKKRIVDHLKATRFIIALRLPKADMDDAGWDANGQILTYFLDHCGALIQADGEGFYEGAKLILEIEDE